MLMAHFSRMFLVSLALFFNLLVPVQASDVLRLEDSFRTLDLTPFIKNINQNDYEFSIQNATNQSVDLLLNRLEPPKLTTALGLSSPSVIPLRLFSSNDNEFVATPEQPNLVRLNVPANQVQTFLLADAVGWQPVYLWSENYYASYQSRLYTVQLSLLSMLSGLLLIAVIVAVLRRSRRAGYAVVMAMGLITLQGSLWSDDLVKGLGTEVTWLVGNDLLIPIAFALGLLMTGVGHLNLLFRRVINRNYWTQVIILTDICLIATAFLWSLAYALPNFAGVIGGEMPHVGLTLTIACILLGVVFLPDRRDTHME